MRVEISVPVKLEFEIPEEKLTEDAYEMIEKGYIYAKLTDFDFPDFSKCDFDYY